MIPPEKRPATPEETLRISRLQNKIADAIKSDMSINIQFAALGRATVYAAMVVGLNREHLYALVDAHWDSLTKASELN